MANETEKPVVGRDPVCGMTPAHRRFTCVYRGTTYVFCCEHCRTQFARHPLYYLSGLSKTAVDEPQAGTVYTCPMDPEVRQDTPGICPKCGMALEPAGVPAAVPGVDPEAVAMTRRFWLCLVFTAPVFACAMTAHVAGLPSWFPPRLEQTAEFALATPVVVWGGWPLLVRGWRSLATRAFNMFTLIGLGVTAAWTYSVVAWLVPGAFPGTAHHGVVPVYFEAAAVITTLVLLGQVLELRARAQTNTALRLLMGLAPQTARVVRIDGLEEDLPLAEVQVGDVLRVRPGERVPVDGIVTEGGGSVDEALVTGEPIPVEKGPGASVIGGTLNGTGGFLMTAQNVGAETLLSRIVALVAQAQRSRAPVQRLADAVAGVFVPVVVAAAAAAFAAWWLWGPEPRLAHALVSAVSVLIVACPCALGLATPVSVMVGVGRGATAGVLIRNAEALELLGRVDTLVVDKTGTLTEGRPTLAAVEATGAEADVLRWAASLERASEHPLAAAVLRGAETRGIALSPVDTFRAFIGEGVTGRVENGDVALGNAALFARLGLALGFWQERAEALRGQGQTVVFVARNGAVAGLLGVVDPVKPSAASAVAELRREGVRVVMLTGDSRATAEAVARTVGIDEIHADVRPDGKADVVRRLQAENRVVAMAGDGVNDAPALAQAQVGIAMGTGTDIAMESAGVTLVRGDFAGVLRARRLGRATMANIRQNLFFAFVYNAVGVPIAAGALYPFFGILLSPMLAAAAMSFSSVSVITNALRLRHVRL